MPPVAPASSDLQAPALSAGRGSGGAAPTPGSFDAVVVGAGPAGTSAALALARAGAKVLLLERGEYPGAKNMFGGMTAYCPAPEELVPRFWERAPWERAVTKRVLTVVGGSSSTSLVFQAGSRSERPSVGAGSTSDRSLTGFTLFSASERVCPLSDTTPNQLPGNTPYDLQ